MTVTDQKREAAGKPRPARKDTKARILDTAQTLFNERGVSNVTTNHIAAELGISPGNLYYHYRNREDIVWHLLERAEAEVDPILHVEPGEVIDAERMAFDIAKVLQVLMDYRFLFTDIPGLVHRDPRIAEEFHNLQERTIARIAGTIRNSYAAGPLLEETPQIFIEAIARNMWVLMINWIGFVRQTNADGSLTGDDLTQGVFHIYAMMRPYMSAEAIADIEAMFDFETMKTK